MCFPSYLTTVQTHEKLQWDLIPTPSASNNCDDFCPVSSPFDSESRMVYAIKTGGGCSTAPKSEVNEWRLLHGSGLAACRGPCFPSEFWSKACKTHGNSESFLKSACRNRAWSLFWLIRCVYICYIFWYYIKKWILFKGLPKLIVFPNLYSKWGQFSLGTYVFCQCCHPSIESTARCHFSSVIKKTISHTARHPHKSGSKPYLNPHQTLTRKPEL